MRRGAMSRSVWFTVAAATWVIAVAAWAQPGAAAVVQNYRVPTPNAEILTIEPGRGQQLWFVEGKARKLGRITTRGRITEFPIPSGYGGSPIAITRSGAVWLSASAHFARMTLTRHRRGRGPVVERAKWRRFARPTPRTAILAMDSAPDGTVWYGGQDLSGGNLSRYGQVTGAGSVREWEFNIPGTNIYPRLHNGAALDVSPVGAIWFSPGDLTMSRIGSDGSVAATYRVPVEPGGPYPAGVEELTANGDGSVAFVVRYIQNVEPIIEAPKVERVGLLRPDGSFVLGPETGVGARVLEGPSGKPWLLQNRAPLQSTSLGPLTPMATPGPTDTFRPDGSVFDMTLGADGRFWWVHRSRNNRINAAAVTPR